MEEHVRIWKGHSMEVSQGMEMQVRVWRSQSCYGGANQGMDLVMLWRSKSGN